MLLALMTVAFSACPEGSEAPARLASDIDAALVAYAAGDSEAYVAAWSGVEVDLACVTKPLPPPIVADYLVLQGVHADLLGDVDDATRWFRAARLADPEVGLPERVAAVKPDLTVHLQAEIDLPQPSPLPEPAGVTWHVDGRDDPIFYEGLPAIVQAVSPTGEVLWTGAVRSRSELPSDLGEPQEDFNRGLLAARGYRLVKVDPGRFEMAPDSLGGLPRVPSREVEIRRPFLIGTTEVTVEVYEAVEGSDPAGSVSEQRPMRGITWADAARFCNALSRIEGLREAYVIEGDEVTLLTDANGYRLPTEAEWAYVARMDGPTRYAGSDDADEVAWYRRNAGGRPHIVATKAPTALGVYDLTGNVAEWVWDTDAGWAPGPAIDPIVETPSRHRIVRGGSYDDKGRALRVGARRSLPASRRDETVGFRVARWLDGGA